MTKVPRVEVITSVERRRRWSRSEKERLVAASFEDGVTASEIARDAGIHVSQLFRWQKELCQPASPTPEGTALVPIEVVPGAPAPDPVDIPRPARTRVRRQVGTIEIDLASGARLRVDRDVDADALRRVLDVLAGR